MRTGVAGNRRWPALAAGMFLLALSGCSWLEWSEPADEGRATVPAQQPPTEPPSAAATLRPAKPPPPRPSVPPVVREELPPPPQPAPAAVEHAVKKGETLFSIARLYDLDAFTLASANGMRPPYAVSEGQRLKVPSRQATAADREPSPEKEKPPAAPSAAPAASPAAPEVAKAAAAAPVPPAVPQPPAAKAGAGFLWPVSGKVISGFGTKDQGMRNDGINIAAQRGTPVRAAEDGVVTYVGNELKGMGNLILLKHEGGWSTVYAHADDLLVAKGDRVKRGQTIARVGSSGDVSRPQLHFQLRRGRDAVDPRRYLPPAT